MVRVRLDRGCGGGDELCAVDVESEVDDEDELDCVWELLVGALPWL